MGYKMKPPPYNCDNTPIYHRDLQADEPGVMGKTNMNGSILVQEGLDPVKEEEVKAHEGQHVEDIKDGLLMYDDDNVYWRKDKSLPWEEWGRADMVEGAKNLPWEVRAWKKNKEFKKQNKNYYNA
jgi:hypothetical protein